MRADRLLTLKFQMTLCDPTLTTIQRSPTPLSVIQLNLPLMSGLLPVRCRSCASLHRIKVSKTRALWHSGQQAQPAKLACALPRLAWLVPVSRRGN